MADLVPDASSSCSPCDAHSAAPKVYAKPIVVLLGGNATAKSVLLETAVRAHQGCVIRELFGGAEMAVFSTSVLVSIAPGSVEESVYVSIARAALFVEEAPAGSAPGSVAMAARTGKDMACNRPVRRYFLCDPKDPRHVTTMILRAFGFCEK